MEIFFRVWDRGNDCGKSPIYDLGVSMRSPAGPLLVGVEGRPGEVSQYNFGEVTMAYMAEPGTETDTANEGLARFVRVTSW